MPFAFAFRFLHGLRTTDPPASRFLFVDAAAAALRGTPFVGVGVSLGQAIETAFGQTRRAEHVVSPVLGRILVPAIDARE